MKTLKAIITRGHFSLVGVVLLGLVVYQGVGDLTRFNKGEATTADLLFDAVLILALLWLNYGLIRVPPRKKMSGK